METNEIKMPTRADGERCLEIRKRSKRGSYSSPDDHKFCLEMLKKHPQWYHITEDVVFNETAPFGSRVQLSVKPLPPYSDQQKAE